MESSAPTSYMLVFDDGPAAEERVSMCVPPTPVRWYCTSGELGSDQRVQWWTMEEPPEDPDIEIVKYVATTTDLASADTNEDGDLEIHYSCAESAPLGSTEAQARRVLEENPELAERLAGIGAQIAEPESIPRSAFSAEDISAMLVNGTWIEVPTPGTILEVVLEPTDGKVKLSIGANLIYKDGNGEFVAITPQAVHGFRFRPSSVAQTPEVHGDGHVRVARDTYDGDDSEVKAAVADAEVVYVVEPNGQHTKVKDRGEFVA